MSKGCTHHFIIDPPNGPTSEGRCKLCGEQRTFSNSTAFNSWELMRQGGKKVALYGKIQKP